MFDNLFYNVLKKFNSNLNGNDSEEVAEIVQLVAVSLFFDSKVTTKEFDKAQEIVNNIYGSDSKYVLKEVKDKLELYNNEHWAFIKDKETIMSRILVDGKWLYAEYMVGIFKSDGIAQKEKEYITKLENIVNDRKHLLQEFGIGVD